MILFVKIRDLTANIKDDKIKNLQKKIIFIKTKKEVRMKEKILKFVEEEMKKLMDDENIDMEEKTQSFDVLLNTAKFLKEYEKNVERLNKQIRAEKMENIRTEKDR